MNNFAFTAAIILAAGRGTRINAKKKNKVTFHLNGKSIIAHAVDNLHKAGISKIYVVVGFHADSVKKELGTQVEYVEQTAQLGTGHAVKTAISALPSATKTVLSVYGDDSAFYPPSLYQTMVEKRVASGCDLLFLTVHKDDPTGLGRIVRDNKGNVTKIVEEKNATEAEKKITEINTGFYCFSYDFLVSSIDKIKKNPVTGEYYLTDMVEIALSNGKKVEALYIKDSSIWHGVNTRQELASAKYQLSRESHAK